jgi:enterochelin esterase-like enzyme
MPEPDPLTRVEASLVAAEASGLPEVIEPPEVSEFGVNWRIPAKLAPGGVRLEVDWVLAGDPEFGRCGDVWIYHLRRPAARRLEYRLVLQDADGRGQPGLDPTNPRRVGNPFGDRSVVQFPDYRPPVWVGTDPEGSLHSIDLEPGRLGIALPAILWTPAGLDTSRPAPLLVANDGTALAEDADLLCWATWLSRAAGPFRVLLTDPAPGLRDRWYAASPEYADDLVEVGLAAVAARVAVSTTIGLGISLGAVATLALQRRHPTAFDAVVLQSGSFFSPQTDPQESGYGHFDQVCRAVRDIKSRPAVRTVPALITCGAIEENLVNNLEMARALADQGYGVEWKVVPDAHTMTGWRDAWSPELDRLIHRVSVEPAG